MAQRIRFGLWCAFVVLANPIVTNCRPTPVESHVSQCEGYSGDVTAISPYTVNADFVFEYGDVSRVVARVPIHNPTEDPLTLNVVCHFHINLWLSGVAEVHGVYVCPESTVTVSALWGGVFDEHDRIDAVCVTLDGTQVVYRLDDYPLDLL